MAHDRIITKREGRPAYITFVENVGGYSMAKLRPYSCPECGSFLEVDRDRDYFDCPFCGNHYDAVYFHGKDLLEQAGECLSRNEFIKAREKYDFLLSKKPEDFEYLYGYACAVGGVTSLDNYDDPKTYSMKLIMLFSNDPRFSSGPAGPYFRKLSELNTLAKRYSELLAKQKRLKSRNELVLTPFYEQKNNVSEIKKEIRAIKAAYDKAYSELSELKPESAATEVSVVKPAVPKKRDALVKPKKTVICKKCGAGLVLNKEKKLYICDHCGVSYDYSVFVGKPKTKADSYLKNGEFELADKMFAKILADDPADFDANRGRILCAGRWIGFIQVKLNENLIRVNWKALNKALDAAIKNSDASDLMYFTELKKLIDNVWDFLDVNVKLDSGHYSDEHARLLERRQELIDNYPGIYREFIEVDKRHRTSRLSAFSDKPDSMFAYRMRILEMAGWNSISEIDPSRRFGITRLKSVKKVIADAKKNAEDEYAEYFTLWDSFMDMIGNYAAFRNEHKELSGEESCFKTKAVFNTAIPSDWDEVRRQRFANEEKDKKLRKEINAFHKKLIETDNKLFYGKQDRM